jgi:hypothetical protein
VPDREEVRLRPRQKLPVAGDEAACGVDAALAPTGAVLGRSMASGPADVFLEGSAFEAAEADVVQLRQDEPRDIAARKGEVGGLLGARELRHDAEVDRIAADQNPEGGRLLAARLCQAAVNARIAVDLALNAEPAFGVPNENSPGQNRRLRYEIVCRMPIAS